MSVITRQFVRLRTLLAGHWTNLVTFVSTYTYASKLSRRLTWNEIDAGWTPRLESWRCSQNAMGFEVSTAAMMDKCTKPLGVWAAGEKWEWRRVVWLCLLNLAQLACNVDSRAFSS